jgi:predicted metalloprotease
LIATSCGSKAGSSSTSQSSTTTVASSGPTSPVKIEGRELDQFAAFSPGAEAKLPAAPKTAALERSYLIAVFDDAQSVWRREFTEAHLAYRPARDVVFWSQIHSKCGEHEDSGPFYCPADHTVYLDLRFFTLLLHESHVGPAAQAYIIGHEVGHHVQRLVGVAQRVDAANHADPSGSNTRSVQTELQADCLAGVWARSAYPRSGLSVSDLNEALKTAHVIGDDYLAIASGGVVDSALWTHGSSLQRQQWLRTGYQSGRPGACDTFSRG